MKLLLKSTKAQIQKLMHSYNLRQGKRKIGLEIFELVSYLSDLLNLSFVFFNKSFFKLLSCLTFYNTFWNKRTKNLIRLLLKSTKA
jgi:hypothetical protein